MSVRVPKEGSRKRQLYDMFFAKGEKAAYKLGNDLGLSKGFVAFWVKAWSAGEEPVLGKPKEKPRKDGPSYHFLSSTAARKAIPALAERSGLPASAYAVEESPQGGRFAIVPNRDQPREEGLFLPGDHVRYAVRQKGKKGKTAPTAEVGVVSVAGLEVSEVIWPSGRKDFISNKNLQLMEEVS